MSNVSSSPAGRSSVGLSHSPEAWLSDGEHRAWLHQDAGRQLDFFRASLRRDGGFDVLDWQGQPLAREPQELHTTTRMVHSYALGQAFGFAGCADMIEAGMTYLWHQHRDREHGGYHWSVSGQGPADSTKLAYGHVFVLLAAASAKQVGHPDAQRLLDDVAAILDAHYWDEEFGLFRDEFNRDWSPFSSYRGMNANMHGVEALLAAYEATGEALYLQRAGRILDFFVGKIAPTQAWRLPEHYREDWSIDPDYQGNPMFRPAGSTPGHSFELGRLTLQHWDLSGRPNSTAPSDARRLIEQALSDAWQPELGGFAYTLDLSGEVAIADRYWWPVTEAIGAMASLIKLEASHGEDEAWYRKLWEFAEAHLVDQDRGGWFPELDTANQPTARQFHGKPDIYHALQADLLPLTAGISRYFEEAGNTAK